MKKQFLLLSILLIIMIITPGNLSFALFKNVSGQKIIVEMRDSGGSLVTGDEANITATISKDGGSFVSTNDVNPAEIGSGFYVFDMTQTETDADLVLLYAVSSTGGNISLPVKEYTRDSTSAQLVDDIWDEPLTGSSHSITTSAGRRLREIAGIVVQSGVAQGSGDNGNQIQLESGSPATSEIFDPSVIVIVAGTGFGQSRRIIEYNGPTVTATVNRDWKVLPDNTSEYQVHADPGGIHVNEGLAQGGTTTTIILNDRASVEENAYIDHTVFIVSGTGQDQSGYVTAYDNITRTATLDIVLDVAPDSTSGYLMFPFLSRSTDMITTTEIVEAGLAARPTAGGVNTIQDILNAIFAFSRGKITKTLNNYEYFDDDGLTSLFSYTVSSGARIPE